MDIQFLNVRIERAMAINRITTLKFRQPYRFFSRLLLYLLLLVYDMKQCLRMFISEKLGFANAYSFCCKVEIAFAVSYPLKLSP